MGLSRFEARGYAALLSMRISDLILRGGVGVHHRAALCADPLAASRSMKPPKSKIL